MRRSNVTDNCAGPDDAWWERSLGIHDARAESYSAFARVLRFPDTVPARSIAVVANVCECGPCAHVSASELADARERACSWTHNINDSMSLAVEHIRLFGGFGIPGATNCLVAARDARRETRRAVDEISCAYQRFGYWTEDTSDHALCPAHASNALGFMSHCLLIGDLGVPAATREAQLFYARFLSHWMPGFADAIRNEAHHPVTTLLGVALAEFAHRENAITLQSSASGPV
ncbi:MAG: hypothetical protein CVT59_07910 [Actinobacteria bacterium HGW-Actinobacteria-1]|nr:MAG: hypothetical protein CVT59_07910 [Actinobacteria bacterium HGW-Actinobacteria-1]